METRQIRRAAERQARKDSEKQTPAPSLATRAESNRANSQHSTGPKTPEGKAAGSGNSFKHGLYSSQLVMPGEDPAALDALKAGLRAEHQPANTTEELLVNEIAEHFWRIRRYRRMEAASLALPDELLVVALTKHFPLYQRFMSAAERGLHRSLTALRQLQKDRGFVPHFAGTPTAAAVSEPPATNPRFARMLEYAAIDPDDAELRELLVGELEILDTLKQKAPRELPPQSKIAG